MEKHFDLYFPKTFSLNYKTYYEDEKYNNLRRCKVILFAECLGNIKDDELNLTTSNPDIIQTNLILTNLNIERGIIQIINSYLYRTVNSVSIREHIAQNLEKGCLTRSINKSRAYNIRCIWSESKFVDLYHTICYNLAVNLDSQSCINSDYIKNKILNNDVDLQNVANMKSKELCPKKYEKIEKKINQRNNLERKIKYSELYKCRKCKRNQCTTERRYARSIDEGVDLTVTCVFCSHSWNA